MFFAKTRISVISLVVEKFVCCLVCFVCVLIVGFWFLQFFYLFSEFLFSPHICSLHKISGCVMMGLMMPTETLPFFFQKHPQKGLKQSLWHPHPLQKVLSSWTSEAHGKGAPSPFSAMFIFSSSRCFDLENKSWFGKAKSFSLK